jgi:hypothetical protein
MTDEPTLTENLASLGLTPPQISELEADDERAWGWLLWLREQAGVTNPAGLLLAKFRSGLGAPDPSAWRGNGPTHPGPNYQALLRACENLVRHTGHEYEEAALAGETYTVNGEETSAPGLFDELGRHPRVGNGATLTDADKQRLLRAAAKMRADLEPERQRRDEDARAHGARWRASCLSRRRVATAQEQKEAA